MYEPWGEPNDVHRCFRELIKEGIDPQLGREFLVSLRRIATNADLNTFCSLAETKMKAGSAPAKKGC